MEKLEPELFEIEEDRIRAAYSRRLLTDHRYSWFNPGNVFIVQDRERRVLRMLKNSGLTNLNTTKVLEIGCGTGQWLRDFIKWGARPENIAGLDLLADRVAEAKRLCPGSVEIRCGNAINLPFPDAMFDVVLQSTVFTSILDSTLRQRIASEMLRVVKDDGFILWYDYFVNNPRNPDVQGVKKQEIQTLFKGCDVKLLRITLAPPLARIFAPYSWLSCYVLGKIPLLCTHYLGKIRKR